MTADSSQSNDFPSEIDAKRVSKAIAYACRILGMREYSVQSMHEKLSLKGFEQAEAQLALQFLLENNWLSDQRFCEVFIRSKVARGQGFIRVAYELNQKGIAKIDSEQAFEAAEVDWQQVCDNTAIKKIESGAIQQNLKGRQKLERFLRSRGFSGNQVFKSINQYFVMGVSTGEYDE